MGNSYDGELETSRCKKRTGFIGRSVTPEDTRGTDTQAGPCLSHAPVKGGQGVFRHFDQGKRSFSEKMERGLTHDRKDKEAGQRGITAV